MEFFILATNQQPARRFWKDESGKAKNLHCNSQRASLSSLKRPLQADRCVASPSLCNFHTKCLQASATNSKLHSPVIGLTQTHSSTEHVLITEPWLYRQIVGRQTNTISAPFRSYIPQAPRVSEKHCNILWHRRCGIRQEKPTNCGTKATDVLAYFLAYKL